MSIEKLLKKISKIRTHSEAAWDGCADDPRFQEGEEGEAFDRDREEWGWEWDAAEAALTEGRLDAATEHLDNARSLEADYGDDSFARSAIAIVEAPP